MRRSLAPLAAGLILATAFLAPATAQAATVKPDTLRTNGCGPIYDEGIHAYISDMDSSSEPALISNGQDNQYLFCNVGVSPAGYFEIVDDSRSSTSLDCLDVNTSVITVDGYFAVALDPLAACDAGGNGDAWNHWSAIKEGIVNGAQTYAFQNAYEPGTCLYFNQISELTPCKTASHDQFQQFTWPGSNLPGS